MSGDNDGPEVYPRPASHWDEDGLTCLVCGRRQVAALAAPALAAGPSILRGVQP